MSRQFCLVLCLAVFALVVGPAGSAFGQGEFVKRPLAPGVLKVVAPNIEVSEGVILPAPMAGLNARDYQPKTIAQKATLKGLLENRTRYHNIWQLEFAYKPLRYITVDIPQPGGKAKRTRVWYLLYRVRNLDSHLSFQEQKGSDVKVNKDAKTGDLNPNELPCRFFPAMLLEGWVQGPDGKYILKSYRDQVLPEAIKAIKKEEKITGQLYDSFGIAKSMIKPSVTEDDGRWGVVTWADADPRINFAMVSVQGLSNAYQQDSSETGGKRLVKTLQLNFWRPGDASFANDKFRCGIQYNDRMDRQVLVCQRYRLPGPDLAVVKVNNETKSNNPMGSVSAGFDPSTLKSAAVTKLNEGEMPDSLVDYLKRSGVSNAKDLSVEVETASARWKLQGDNDEVFIVTVRPTTWEVRNEEVKFVGPLESFWYYRYIY